MNSHISSKISSSFLIITLLFCSFFFTSCGTIFTGTSSPITIKSVPESSSVYIDGQYRGQTPVIVSLARDRDHNFLIKKDGFNESTGTIQRSFNKLALLNTIFFFCWIVDMVSGAAWDFENEALTVKLDETINNL